MPNNLSSNKSYTPKANNQLGLRLKLKKLIRLKSNKI